MKDANGLTPKQARFVAEYLKDLNGTQAAIRAGYSKRTASSIATEYLRKPALAAEIARKRAKMAEKLEITAERIAAELALIGFANMQDYMRAGPDGDPYLDFSKLTRAQAAALAEVTVEDFKDGRGEDARDVRRVKFKLADKRAALVDLGKHLGMFVERHEVGEPGEFGRLSTDEIRARAVSELVAQGMGQRQAEELAWALGPKEDGESVLDPRDPARKAAGVSMSDFPPPPETAEFMRLAESIRGWRPNYRVGDSVTRRALGRGDHGIVRAFHWRGNHLMATVEFGRGEETFAASAYVGCAVDCSPTL